MAAGLQMTIFNIPFRIRAEFLFGTVLLGAGRLSEPLMLAWWIFAVALFVGIHELGHAMMFRRYGHEPRIELIAFGGFTQGTPGKVLTPKQDFVVSLAGPMVGLLVGGTVFFAVKLTGFEPESQIVARVIQDILWVTIGWSVFNLLPIIPLDGGRVFSAVMRHFLGEQRGLKIALVVSLIVAVGGGLYAFSEGYVFAGIFAALFAMSSFKQLNAGPQTVAAAGSPIEHLLRTQLSESRFAEALATLRSASDINALDPFVVGYTFVANDLLQESIAPLQRAAAEGREEAISLLKRVESELSASKTN